MIRDYLDIVMHQYKLEWNFFTKYWLVYLIVTFAVLLIRFLINGRKGWWNDAEI